MNGNLTINGNISVNSTNIALGFQAGNIVNGDQVGLPNGLNSTAVGSYTGMNHTGTNNTFIGSVAGQSSTTSYFSRTGSNNTYVGYAAQANGNYSNSTAIGTGAIITATNQIVLGVAVTTVSIPGKVTYNTTPAIFRNADGAQNIPTNVDTVALFPTNSARSGTLTGIVYGTGSNGYTNGGFTNTNSYMVTVSVNVFVTFTANNTGFRALWIQHSGVGRLGMVDLTATQGDMSAISTGHTFTLTSYESFNIQVFHTGGTGLILINGATFKTSCSVLVM